VPLLLALAVGSLALAAGAPALPAAASCAGTPKPAKAIADGGTIFVGTAVSTTNGGRWATFADDAVASHRSIWAITAAVAVFALIIAVTLWGLFRRGSIADRARTDVPDPDEDRHRSDGSRPSSTDPGA